MKTENVSPEKVSARRNRDELHELVLQTLEKNEAMSTNEIAIALGYKKLTDTLRQVVSDMIANGEVVYLYPEKPRSKNQKILLNR